MKAAVDVSIIIVNYNTKALTLSCLASLKQSYTNDVTHEIIVVDNASTDGSVEALQRLQKSDPFFRTIRIIALKENTGFARGNNSGMKRASGRYLLLLNSDTVVKPGTLKEMIAFMDGHKKAGASTCKLVLPTGMMDPACHRGFPTPWAALTYFLGLERLFPKSAIFGQYHQGYKDLTTAHPIDVPSGAFFLVRHEILSDVGGLDEDYFMYGEDIDWAYRIKKHGWEIWFNPSVSVTHLKKQSGRAHQDKQIRKSIERHFYETMILFYQKHYRNTYPPGVTFLIILIIRFRLLLLSVFSI